MPRREDLAPTVLQGFSCVRADVEEFEGARRDRCGEVEEHHPFARHRKLEEQDGCGEERIAVQQPLRVGGSSSWSKATSVMGSEQLTTPGMNQAASNRFETFATLSDNFFTQGAASKLSEKFKSEQHSKHGHIAGLAATAIRHGSTNRAAGKPGKPTSTPIVEKSPLPSPTKLACKAFIQRLEALAGRVCATKKDLGKTAMKNKMGALEYVGNKDLYFLDATAQVQARATLDAKFGNITEADIQKPPLFEHFRKFENLVSCAQTRQRSSHWWRPARSSSCQRPRQCRSLRGGSASGFASQRSRSWNSRNV